MTKQTPSHWKANLLDVRLPRWHELPDMDIYMDQLIQLIDHYTLDLYLSEDNKKGLTPSMVNNYVKLQLVPKPNKKKYNKQHLARLLAITILKKGFDIPSIKQGIEYQTNITTSKDAYNFFCNHIEQTIDFFINSDKKEVSIEHIKGDFAPIQMACTTLIAKIIAEKELNDLLQQTKETSHD